MPQTPTKKRKTTNTTPHKGKTLDFFFGAKPKAPSESPTKIKSEASDAQVLTDEEYARQLAKRWAEEDGGGTSSGSANTGTSSSGLKKRPRSPSSETAERRRNGTDGAVDEVANAATAAESKANEEDKDALGTVAPVEASDGAVTLQAEKETIELIDSIPFDTDPLKFDPDAYSHLMETWPNGKATYGLLTRAFVLINSTRSRIKIVDTLVNFLRTMIRLDPESLLPAVWLTTNDIGPPYEENELGIGSSIITKALTKTSGVTPAALKKLWNKYGDAGDVAFEAKAKQKTLMMRKPRPLTIQNVYTTLTRISTTSGKGSQDFKEGHVKRLLVDAKGEEIRYLTRTFIRHLRIGAVKTTMLIALARAFTLTRPRDTEWGLPEVPEDKEGRGKVFQEAEEVLKECYARRPNYNDIVPVLLRSGVPGLDRECGIALHIPLKPMLGQITRDLDEMLTKLAGHEFTCEYKYDGQRAQIHCDDTGKVSIFSRHLELMTSKYPDLVDLVPRIRGEGVRNFMLEGEVVAMNRKTGEVQPFQMLAGRERKNVILSDISVDVCLFAFDLMYLNDEPLLGRPLRERRELLRTKFQPVEHHFQFVPSLDASPDDAEKIHTFFAFALSSRCEGLMVKLLDNPDLSVPPTNARTKPLLATYTPDKRLDSWLKVKKDYTAAGTVGSQHTLDLVPVAAWHGIGRKAAFWSPILLAARDEEQGTLVPVCKIMSGLTDKFYNEINERWAERLRSARPHGIDAPESIRPHTWVEPGEVWEIGFADVTVSPVYRAGREQVDGERGLSLRFPRLVRERGDKGLEEASTVEELVRVWEYQTRGGGAVTEGGKEQGIEEDLGEGAVMEMEEMEEIRGGEGSSENGGRAVMEGEGADRTETGDRDEEGPVTPEPA